ncbi:MAG: hypothetical protein VW954_05275, partial [Alphaproteobacteria bacterium]
VLENSPNLSVGNVIGSNISNVILVLGFALLISSIQFKNIKKFDILFHLIIHLLFFIIFYFMNFNSTFGYIFIILFIFYIFRSLKSSASNEVSDIELEKNTISILTFENPIKYGVPIIFLSILITLMGAQLTVNSAIKISNILKISESFLGLTIIAIGTSLPEIATSIRAAKRKKSEIIIGNIIGSNIYNLLLILGASSLFKNFKYDKSILTTEVIFLVFCVFLLSILLAINFKFKKKQSLIFIFLYLIYLYNLYNSNF